MDVLSAFCGVLSMAKALAEMSLEELWELFPITLKEHNCNFKDWYAVEEKKILRCGFDKHIKRISHIGSTAVNGLIAKPTIDILLELDNKCVIPELVKILQCDGWILMSSKYEPDLRLIFNKGYKPSGFAEKVYHLHVRYYGDYNELYFRDYLIDHHDVAEEYGNLKLRLCEEYKHDRDGYTAAKSEFVMHYTNKAREAYPDRYKPSLP